MSTPSTTWSGRALRDPVTYGEVRHLEEVQFSVYNFEQADVEKLWEHLRLYESECQQLLSRAAQQPQEAERGRTRRFPVLAAYDLCLKCSHLFNLLDARGAISVTERVGIIARIRVARRRRRQGLLAQMIAQEVDMAELLLEIGLEEIPARMIAAAEAELARRVEALLTPAALAGRWTRAVDQLLHSAPAWRCGSHGVLAQQLDMQEQLTGPSWKAAFPGGQPGPAAQAFAKKAGVPVAALEKIITPKGEYAAATIQRPGQSAGEGSERVAAREMAALSWPKTMYWRAGKPERFVRPLRWLLCLLDENVVALEFAGIRAGHVSYGHRVLHGDSRSRSPGPLTISQHLRQRM